MKNRIIKQGKSDIEGRQGDHSTTRHLQSAFDEVSTHFEEYIDEESMELITETELQNLLLAKQIYEEQKAKDRSQ